MQFIDYAKQIYNYAPTFGKNMIEITWQSLPVSIKYGKKYRKYTRLLMESQWWSREQQVAYQIKKLRELFTYVYNYIPYYKRIFNEIGFNPKKFSSMDEIEKIPFSSKELMLDHSEEMISTKIPRKNISIYTTGGTTGKQARFYREKNTYAQREFPFINAIWGRVGYNRALSKVAQLRNQVLPKGCLWEYDWKNNVLIFDAYHLSDSNIGAILRKMAKWETEYLHTYPSSALILCDYLKRRGEKYQGCLKAVLVTSENLYPGQKEIIEKYFQARCFTFYGHSECAAIAGWCEFSDKYHIQSEYGYLELVDETGKVIHEPNKVGEIVCTGFDSFAMPFIRYKTGDYSSYAENQNCSCGRHYILMNEIFGRWTQEMFIGKSGNKISMAAINMHNDIFKNVENYQFIQNVPGECVLRIVRNNFFTESDEKDILQELQSKFEDSMEIEVEYVSVIERTIRGKQRFIIQNIK